MPRWIVLLPLVAASVGRAAIVNETVTYRDGDVNLRGYVAWDDAVPGPRPGVLVIHEWYGLNDFARAKADELAAMGYVALAADMYGDGRVAANRDEAAQLAGTVRGTPLMRTRATAAFEALRQRPLVDPRRIAAIGFCFGGTGVLELAYTGADLAGVVSFHGGLSLPTETDTVKARILVLAGAKDRASAPDAVGAWQAAMDAKSADWQFVAYSGAVHAFMNPAAGNDPSRGAAYDPRAAARAWAHMKVFFAELFG